MKGTALIAVLAAAAALQGCSRPGPAQTAMSQSAAPPADYLPTPELSGATRQAGGSSRLAGTGSAGARVRLASPDGSALFTTADRSGVWTFTLPASASPRLYSLSEDVDGRLVRARGYVALLPSPGPAAVELRPAAAAAPIASGVGMSILTLDFDASGVAVASGRARPGQVVRMLLDGIDAGENRADAVGIFDVTLSQVLRPGTHELVAQAAGGEARARFQASPPAPVASGFFSASRVQDAWRITWVTPGGGVQSTVVFDVKGARG